MADARQAIGRLHTGCLVFLLLPILVVSLPCNNMCMYMYVCTCCKRSTVIVRTSIDGLSTPVLHLRLNKHRLHLHQIALGGQATVMLQLMPPNSGKPGSAAAAGDRGSDSGCPNENGGDVNAQLHRNLAIYFFTRED